MAVEVAAALSIDLYGRRAGCGDAAGVVVGLQIALNDGHAQCGAHIPQGAFEQAGLPRTRRADQVERKDAVTGKIRSEFVRFFGIGFQYVAHNRNLHMPDP